MNSYLFRILENSSIDAANEELLLLGLDNLFVIEDDASGEILIGGSSAKDFSQSVLKHSSLAEVTAVSWEDQWALFAEDFREGLAHIDLGRFGGAHCLELLPGPGFGDLSHPTTYLMLELMQGRIKKRRVIDIGCGSGILTLAALLLGASSACGIDIEPQALEHARQNATLNRLSAEFTETVPSYENEAIVLMNMIVPEQKVVMQQQIKGAIWIVSGILADEREKYLALAKEWGWELVEEKERGGWLGMVFIDLTQRREKRKDARFL
jgi:ribosomal protein L11 methyltransferase